MANQSEVADLLIEGAKGFVARPDHDFKAGEFRQLTNAEIVEGRIQSRRCIKQHGYNNSSIANTVMSTGVKAIGFYGQWTIYASETQQVAFDGVGNRQAMFNPSTMIDLGGDLTGWGRPVGFFEYNNNVYWLVLRYNSAVGIVGIDIYTTSSDVQKDPSSFTTATISYTRGFYISYDSLDFAKFKYNNFTIFKDRLWVSTKRTVYFSAATQPNNFNVNDDGGFFRFPDDTVNYVMAVGDLVYVICDKSIWTITYNTSPNDDATVRKISGDVGGIQGCIYEDTPYFINNDGIFTISNSKVDKVINSDLDEGLNDFTNQSLNAYQNYLIINKTYERNTDSLPEPDSGSALIIAPRINIMPDPGQLQDPLTYWEPLALPANQETTNQTVGFAHNGTTVMRLKRLGPSPTVDTLKIITKNDARIPVKPHSRYVFSYYARRPAASVLGTTKTTSVFVDGYVDGVSVGGSAVGEPDGVVASLAVPDVWVRNTIKFRTEEANSVEFTINIESTGTPIAVGNEYFIDSLLLEEQGALPAKSYFDSSFAADATYTYIGTDLDGNYDPWINVAISVNPAFNYYRNLYPYMKVASPSSENLFDYNLYFLNMDNGAMHCVDYRTRLKDVGTFNDPDFICDVVFNPNPNPTTATGSLMLRSSDARSTSADNYKGASLVAFMEYERTRSAQDEVAVLNAAGTQYTKKGVKQNIVVEISQFNPDGYEYLIKKFRNLEFMGTLPGSEFNVSFGYNDRTLYQVTREVVDVKPTADYRLKGYHVPHRVGINQRAHAINIMLFSEPAYETFNEPYDSFEISNLRLLYLPTTREVGTAGWDGSNIVN